MLDDNLSDDELYELLSRQTRRKAVRYFNQASGNTHSIGEIAGYLHEETEESFTDIETKLHHCDLPKLEEADVVIYEEDERLATYLGNELLEESLEIPE